MLHGKIAWETSGYFGGVFMESAFAITAVPIFNDL
jgi:hypothetical protein